MRAGPPDVDGGSKLQGDWVSEHGPLSFLVLGVHWAVKAFTEVPCHLQLQGSAPDVQNCLPSQGPGCGTRQHVATCSLKQSRAQTSWPAPLESEDLRSSQRALHNCWAHGLGDRAGQDFSPLPGPFLSLVLSARSIIEGHQAKVDTR